MRQRLISAIIALIIFIPLVILGGIYFKIGVSLIGALAIKEVLNIKNKLPFFIEVVSYILTSLLIFFDINIIVKLFIVISLYFISLVFYDSKKYNIEDAVYLMSFSILIILVFSMMYTIRNNDINVLIYLFLITILTDTFAYIGGRLFGKHKLLERVSPNKTIEGSIIGSVLGTVVPTIFYIYMIDPGQYILVVTLITLFLSILGQLGDLVFSSIKRYYKIKDFSNIMPGHGGILDRFDSIIFVIIGYIIIINLF